MTQRHSHYQFGCIGLCTALLAGCYVPPVEPPVPARSVFHASVLDVQPTGVVVRADYPLSWVVVEMRPAGQVWVAYADSTLQASGSGRAVDTLRFDWRSSRPGLVVAGGSSVHWVVPCEGVDRATYTDPLNGRTESYEYCGRAGPGYTQGAYGRAVLDHGYFLTIGSTTPSSPPAIDRVLRTVRPTADPDSLAAAVGAVLFRDRSVQWDYAVSHLHEVNKH